MIQRAKICSECGQTHFCKQKNKFKTCPECGQDKARLKSLRHSKQGISQIYYCFNCKKFTSELLYEECKRCEPK